MSDRDDFWDFYDDYTANEEWDRENARDEIDDPVDEYGYEADNEQHQGACYLATSAYGSYECPEVWVLRRFRDQYLAKFGPGRLFISAYYKTSPKAVQLFGRSRLFNFVIRVALQPLIFILKRRGISDLPYKD